MPKTIFIAITWLYVIKYYSCLLTLSSCDYTSNLVRSVFTTLYIIVTIQNYVQLSNVVNRIFFFLLHNFLTYKLEIIIP